jgi:hypothetical protein
MCLHISYEKKLDFFCILKVSEERSWIRILWSEVQICGSRSAPKMSRIPNTDFKKKSLPSAAPSSLEEEEAGRGAGGGGGEGEWGEVAGD